MADATDDVEAIKQLKARSFRTMDTKRWDEMRAVFTNDVTMDTTASGGGVITGGDEFMAFLRETLGDLVATVDARSARLPAAAEAARDRAPG